MGRPEDILNPYIISSLLPDEDPQSNEAEHIDNNLTKDVRILRDNARVQLEEELIEW